MDKPYSEIVREEIVGAELIGDNPFGPLWHAGWESCRKHLLGKVNNLPIDETDSLIAQLDYYKRDLDNIRDKINPKDNLGTSEQICSLLRMVKKLLSQHRDADNGKDPYWAEWFELRDEILKELK